MEKFLLSTFLADDKLNIVNEQHVVVSVFFPEFRGRNIIFVPDGIDQFVGEFLTGYVEDLCFRIVFQNKVGDRVHQVGFAQSHAAVDKQRVVNFAGRFRHSQGSGMSQVVVGAHYEGVEGVAGI